MSERIVQVGLSCPACGHKLTRSEQRSMNTVLGAAQPIACSGCGRSIQWHRSLHGRIFVGGLMFRLGGLAVFACIAGALFLPRLPVSYGVAATVAVTLAVVGVLVTYTPASRTFVELASNDA